MQKTTKKNNLSAKHSWCYHSAVTNTYFTQIFHIKQRAKT